MKENKQQPGPFANLFEQAANISKGYAYDVLVEQVGELKEENVKLKARVKYLEELIKEYSLRMKANLSGEKVD